MAVDLGKQRWGWPGGCLEVHAGWGAAPRRAAVVVRAEFPGLARALW